MKREKNSQAQSFVSYALLIAITAGALIATRIFITRAVQEKFRQSADVFGQGEQYERGRTTVTNLDGSVTNVVTPPPPITGPCSYIVGLVNGAGELAEQVGDLMDRADTADRSAAAIEAPLLALEAQARALTAEISQKTTQSYGFREQAAAKLSEADVKQAQIDQYRESYPNCFGFMGVACPDDISADIAQLQTDISNLHSQADSLVTEANSLLTQAADLRSQLAPLNSAIAQVAGPVRQQSQDIRATAADFRNQANVKQAEIDQYKNDYPECF